MADEKKTSSNHTVIMEQRENISITGVLDVISFDEEAIIAETEMGVIILKGTNLHVSKLNLEKGELNVDGEVYSLAYEESGSFGKDKGSFFSKIFK